MLSLIAVIAAFGSAISLVSGVIAVYDFFKNHTIPPGIRNVLVISVVISLLFLTLLFTIPSLSSPSRDNNVSINTQPTATAAPTFTPAPSPTPVPSTSTPTPPPQCTNQDGASPHGVEATQTTINCTLPSGFAAMIVVCNHAHLLQPFDKDLEGPGMISYQSTTGSSSINIQAENSALANAACPSKFLVLPLSQVDGQAAVEVLRLKDLIGNNAGITDYKVIGTDFTKNYT